MVRVRLHTNGLVALAPISKGSVLVFFLATEGNAVHGRVEEALRVLTRPQVPVYDCVSHSKFVLAARYDSAAVHDGAHSFHGPPSDR